MDLEGMVSKKRNSPYRSGYTKTWLKVKSFLESEFVIVGYDTTPGGVRSLLVAREDEGRLSYAGRVMVTLRGPKREAIWAQLEKHRTDRPPLPELQHGPEVEWFTPRVQVRVRHLRGEETLRHATLLGLAIRSAGAALLCAGHVPTPPHASRDLGGRFAPPCQPFRAIDRSLKAHLPGDC
jgi:bifunctional non-homologous end joining protein LigD